VASSHVFSFRVEEPSDDETDEDYSDGEESGSSRRGASKRSNELAQPEASLEKEGKRRKEKGKLLATDAGPG